MPPCLDIYGLTRSRTTEAIELFVDAYAPAAYEMRDIEVVLASKELNRRPFLGSRLDEPG